MSKIKAILSKFPKLTRHETMTLAVLTLIAILLVFRSCEVVTKCGTFKSNSTIKIEKGLDK